MDLELACGGADAYRGPTRRKDEMTIPEDKSPGRDVVEHEAEQTIPDLEVTDEGAAEQVKGGFRAVRNTTRGFPSFDQGTDEPAQSEQL